MTVETIRSWILSLIGAALLCSLAMWLTPESRVKRVLRLACGAVMAASLVSPVLSLDMDVFSLNLEYYRSMAEDITSNAEEKTDRLSRTIIEERCSAYILDKAQVIDESVSSVKVTAKWGGEASSWYPYEVTVTTRPGGNDHSGVKKLIEAELGIPEERQYWNSAQN